jgi:hypothetical protein
MQFEINNLRTSLASTVLPGVLREAPDVWFGVGRFEDCAGCAHNMAMLQEMTDDIPSVEAALTGWSTCGGNQPYPHYLYTLATGDVSPFLGWGGVTPTTWTCTSPGNLGWPCFRTDALPVIVQFGDQSYDVSSDSCSPGMDHSDAITALNSIGAKYIGVNSSSGSPWAHDDMIIIATGTGSVDSTGNPLVFDISSDGSGLGTQVVDAILTLAFELPMEVSTRLSDDTTDAVDAVAEFVDHVQPSVVGGRPDPRDPPIVCVPGLEVADLYPPTDGRADSFSAVQGGTPVCFDLMVKQNWTVPAATGPMVFQATMDVVVDSLTVLDTRSVYFLVPLTGVSSTTIVCED